MPRQPLGEISSNLNYKGGLKGRFELTPYWRSHIIGRAAGGQTLKAIAFVGGRNMYQSAKREREVKPDCVDDEDLH